MTMPPWDALSTLAFLAALASPSLTCTLEGFVVVCRLKTSSVDGWFGGLDHRWKPIRVDLTFDTTEVQVNITDRQTFPNGNLVLNVHVAVEICRHRPDDESRPRESKAECLDGTTISETMNAIVELFPDVSHLEMISNSTVQPVSHHFLKKPFHQLEEIKIDGLHLENDQGGDLSILPELRVLTFARSGVKSLAEVFSLGCCGRATNLVMNSNDINDLSPPKPWSPAASRLLQYLELDNNSLEVIESDNILRRMKGLVSLSLAANRINRIEDGAFCGLSKLIYLSLRDNHLLQVPVMNSGAGSPILLKELILRRNNITSVDPDKSLDRVPGLSILDLRFNQIVSFTFTGVLENLTNLFLSDNQLKNFEVTAKRSALMDFKLAGNDLETFDRNLVTLVFNLTTAASMLLDVSRNPLRNCDLLRRMHGSNLSTLPRPNTCTHGSENHTCKFGGRSRTILFSCEDVPVTRQTLKILAVNGSNSRTDLFGAVLCTFGIFHTLFFWPS